MTCKQRLYAAVVVMLLAAVIVAMPAHAQQMGQPIDPSLYSGMRWRLIGPHRGGRVSAVVGIPGDPATYYMGTPGGGIWKTTDSGEVWNPIFDHEHVASIGALAIAPSNPAVIYAGTGEQTAGNGVYKSTDAGATWTNIGLQATGYISSIIVDPRDPNILVVGVIGHPILGIAASGPERGVFKTTDGGKTWTKTLYRDEVSGVSDMCVDPGNSRVLYATVWHPRDFRTDREPPTASDAWLYKSTDEGSTWSQLPGTGMPPGAWDRPGVAVAPGNHGRRVFVITGSGLFRSDDSGTTWRQITKDPRVISNLYISHVYVDPRDADVVYVMQTSLYRSTDGGQTFAAFKGAPGGDDYHVMWIDPQNSHRMILGVDQGAIITLNDGKTWSSWFNQATGQFYHAIADNQFPYIVYAPQQDSGTVAISSRSDYGSLTYRDWFSIGGFEYSYIAPDPLNPNIVYSGGWFGSVLRFDRITGQFVHVFVRTEKYRTATMAPVVFSPLDPRTLYFATQYVMKTTNEGKSWKEISPDLTVRPKTSGDEEHKHAAVPEPRITVSSDSQGAYLTARFTNENTKSGEIRSIENSRREYATEPDPYERGEVEQAPRRPHAISVVSPSPLQANVIWAGTNNGLIQLTRDGATTWQNVSPADLTDQANVWTIEPSHYDANTAYLAIEVRRDRAPYIYRTRDAGKSWQKITEGLRANWLARAVREDAVRKGLLYAATEDGVYVSFDDGDHWQSLQLNLPTSDVQDLTLHGNDLVAATYGRALWILDDLSPLRQASAEIGNSNAYLFHPAETIRARWDNDQETPLPPEFPAGKNPPDGVIFNYFLKSVPTGELTLEIHDAQGTLVRRFTSLAAPPVTTLANVPDYWFEDPKVLSKNVGLNRFVWDLRIAPPPALNYGYYGEALDYIEYTLSDHAIPYDTPREQTLGPFVVPGQYEAVFIGNDQLVRQKFTVTKDPRVHVSQDDLVAQWKAAKRIVAGLKSSYDSYQVAKALRDAVADRLKSLGANANVKNASDTLKDLDKNLEAVTEGTNALPGVGPVNRDLSRTMFTVESGDAAPSDSARAAIEESCAQLNGAISQWREINTQTAPQANVLLEKYKLPSLPIAAAIPAGDACHE
ncbi:MAG TPA: hypothetical protein VEX69_02615 [Candidatus Limnocylindria bacterium]|nr:hypothetical protein [Candidatus Limnocylindria bacterium]